MRNIIGVINKSGTKTICSQIYNGTKICQQKCVIVINIP